jgi:hypothetical protein
MAFNSSPEKVLNRAVVDLGRRHDHFEEFLQVTEDKVATGVGGMKSIVWLGKIHFRTGGGQVDPIHLVTFW